MSEKKSIVWFRQDLRLADNPAFYAAASEGSVLPIFILDDDNAGDWSLGAASRVWLHHSLCSLNASLDEKLSFHQGNPIDVLHSLIQKYDIDAVYWNRCYEPWRISRDKAIKAELSSQSVQIQSFNGSLLWEPWDISKADGTPYRVFTPYFRKGCMNAKKPRKPLPKPEKLHVTKDDTGVELSRLALLPNGRDWNETIETNWKFGENAAHIQLSDFLDSGLAGYKEGRNYPAKAHVSRLSPYLHWGEISPNTVWHAARAFNDSTDVDHFCSELGWREFSYALLYNFPDLPSQNFQAKFDAFPWDKNPAALEAWCHGRTGVPIVDAGMRELWQTGFMHNRVRMIVASYLIKNLKIDWRDGEKWFWDTLVDADLASNSASWQWVAGSGADAAPYFRIFNPVTQGEKFDPDGTYIHQYVPELSKLKGKHLYAPWAAPKELLEVASVQIGKTYPAPLVDLKLSREEALTAFKELAPKN